MPAIIQTLAQRLARGKPVLSTWSTLADPAALCLLMQEDFDTIVLDLQHGVMDYAGAVTAIGTIALCGKPSIVRIPVDDFALASRMIDAGAAAIIAPMISTAEDTRRLVNAVKYPPIGERSCGPNAALFLSGMVVADYFKVANDFTLTLAMIETRAAMANIDAILAVPGLDGIIVGPADLSVGLSDENLLDAFSPAVTEAIKTLQQKAKAAGKYMATFAPTPEQAKAHLASGMALVAHPGDANYMVSGAREALKIIRG